MSQSTFQHSSDQSPRSIAQKIDHTLLKPTMSLKDLENLCSEAKENLFATVCVPPCWVKSAASFLKGTSVGVCTVVGFPLGYTSTTTKTAETKQAIQDGATEIDMVMNLTYAKSGDFNAVEADIAAVAKACGTTPLKVIIETAYLTYDEKIQAALASEKAGATFVKTSTGFATGLAPGLASGATIEDIKLLRATLKPHTKIKASGGIKDLAQAQDLIKAGADRLGTSSGVAILNGLSVNSGY